MIRQKNTGLYLTLAGIFLILTCYAVQAEIQDSHVFNVVQYGAVGDTETINTKAIQSAIDACSEAGGGTVQFPPGKYLSGTLFLKNNVRLNLDMACTILGSTNIEDYPTLTCDFPSRSDCYTSRALIWGEGLENVAITGYGTIDGQGSEFRDNVATTEDMAEITKQFKTQGRYLPKERYFNRPYLIRLITCKFVRIENVRLLNSPMWMQQYLNCDFVTVRGIHVSNHGCRNNDMIDIDGCRNVTISDCYGDSDDDALTLKSTGNATTEHVTITNCILSSHCNALKAGTESVGGFKDITISNCVIKRSPVETVLAGRAEGLAGIALEIVDGGTMERVTISNIVIEGTSAPIFLRLGNRARPSKPSDPKPPVGKMRNISINNIVATGAFQTGCSITGLPGYPIENVSLSNINIHYQGGGTQAQATAEIPEFEDQYPESTMFGILPAYGFFCRHIEGLKFNNVELRYAVMDARPAIICDDVLQLRVTNFDADYDTALATALLLKDTRKAFIAHSMPFSMAKSFCQQKGSCEDISIATN